MSDTNVVTMSAHTRHRRAARPPPNPAAGQSLVITIPLDPLEDVPARLFNLGVAVDLAVRVVGKRVEHGDQSVVDGLQQVFTAFAAMCG